MPNTMDPRELQERMNALNGDVYELTPAIAGHFGLVFSLASCIT
jgi:hypothetical protein